MAQQSQTPTGALLETIDALSSLDEEDTRSFVREALGEIREHLVSNRTTAEGMGVVDMDVDEVLTPDNVESIKVRARPFENPRVTVWLKDCPMWANDAWRDTFHPHGLNAYNGKVTTTFDVRQV